MRDLKNKTPLAVIIAVVLLIPSITQPVMGMEDDFWVSPERYSSMTKEEQEECDRRIGRAFLAYKRREEIQEWRKQNEAETERAKKEYLESLKYSLCADLNLEELTRIRRLERLSSMTQEQRDEIQQSTLRYLEEKRNKQERLLEKKKE